MRNKLKERLPKVNFILGATLFLLSSFSFYGDGQTVQAIVFLLLGLGNLALVRFSNGTTPWVNLLVMGFNSAGAVMVALDYQNKGTTGLHLVWWFVAVLYLVSIGIHVWKNKQPDTPIESE